MNNLLPIGQFSRVCSLTIKALRHYDQEGLLRPARIDPESGYRYYTPTQIGDARRIRLLRSLDMPLEDIAEYLAERDPAAQRAILVRHRERMTQRLSEYQQVLGLLESLIQGGDRLMAYEVVEKEIPGQQVASVRLHTSIAQIPADFASVLGEIFRFIGQQRVACIGAPVALFHDPEFNKEDIDLEICVPVDRAPAAEGRVQSRMLPPAKMAATMHVGPYDALGNAYQELGKWIEQNRKETAGPTREVYLVGPGMAPDASGYRTEIQWPVK